MLSRWQKQNIVHGFLNTMSDEERTNWYHSIEDTYRDMKEGHHGEVTYDGMNYTLYMKNGVQYSWNESTL